jgi:hypothetical protein
MTSRSRRLRWWVSTGARGYATPIGHFKVSWLDEHHKSKQYNDAPMPYAIFFDEGKAIHGFAGSVGGPASHGCVRLHKGGGLPVPLRHAVDEALAARAAAVQPHHLCIRGGLINKLAEAPDLLERAVQQVQSIFRPQ